MICMIQCKSAWLLLLLVEHRPWIHRVIELPKMNVPAPQWTNWIPMHDDTSPKCFISKWDLRNCLMKVVPSPVRTWSRELK
ncbi:hypothetical protein SeMB42_g07685 [Synchytrium endobioticum]|uniref:Secreted protein n=1 Tax=Synchytrium endobioticum TaxID=286115 RepID=A0A507BWR5_9FUNG|nr:hypothetical protein SeMB42_g07685 [Synchytrium endobioticum]